jgi:hypothetical protein
MYYLYNINTAVKVCITWQAKYRTSNLEVVKSKYLNIQFHTILQVIQYKSICKGCLLQCLFTAFLVVTSRLHTQWQCSYCCIISAPTLWPSDINDTFLGELTCARTHTHTHIHTHTHTKKQTKENIWLVPAAGTLSATENKLFSVTLSATNSKLFLVPTISAKLCYIFSLS